MCLRTAYQLLCNHLTDQKLEFLCQSILYFLEKKSICLLQKNQLLHPKTGELKNMLTFNIYWDKIFKKYNHEL